jgi:hypothetical protein
MVGESSSSLKGLKGRFDRLKADSIEMVLSVNLREWHDAETIAVHEHGLSACQASPGAWVKLEGCKPRVWRLNSSAAHLPGSSGWPVRSPSCSSVGC